MIAHERNKTLAVVDAKASATPSTVVLIISPSDRPSTADLERARSLMSSLRASFYDLYFVYASQFLSDYQDINNEYLDYSEMFLQVRTNYGTLNNQAWIVCLCDFVVTNGV